MADSDLANLLELLEKVQSSENIEKSLKYLELELKDETKVAEFLAELNCRFSKQPVNWKYSCYLFYLLAKVIQKVDVNSPEESKVVNDSQINAIVHAISQCSVISLELCVKKHENRVAYNSTYQSEDEYHRLTSCLRMFHLFFNMKIVSSNSLFDDAKLDYLIGVLAVVSLKKNQEDVTDFSKVFSNLPTTFSTELVFKFLMMIRGFQGLSKEFQLLAHRQLMKMIRSSNGFLMLCRNLLVTTKSNQLPLWQTYSMISKIIEAVVKIQAHQKFMIDEIFKTLDYAIENNEPNIVGACTFVLKNLEALPDVRSPIHSIILQPLNELANPEILLFGSIIMEHYQIKALINRLQALFSTSTVASLPSIILCEHIGIIFNLYHISSESSERDKLANIFVFFLRNRDRQELQNIISHLRLKDSDTALKLHPRVCFNNNSLQIGAETNEIMDDTESFLHLLKNSNNNFLIYDVFICLINLLGNVQNFGVNYLTEYDVNEEDLPEVLHQKFFKKLTIIEPLQEMIQWRSLESQLNEKPMEVLNAITEVLNIMVESNNSLDEQLIVIFFSIFKELIQKVRDENKRNQMKKKILEIKEKCKNSTLREQIHEIFNLKEEVPSFDPLRMAFDDALKLSRSSEVYCKVYGSDMLIKLLKKRDEQTVLNRHTILAVAMQNLKETESYAYLNVIRLLVTLTSVMDAEVIDALVAQYKNDEIEIDERLKIGEVIVKVTEDLGVLSAKFQKQLTQCFLNGSRDNNNEFRASSLVNLGTICKILSYQIHSFFQDMFQQLEVIIKSDDYLPSRRAAVMVLALILGGLPNLMDFQEYLSPIYRLLKDVKATEDDPQTRLHADVALDNLNVKTKEFLNPDLKVAKEIKIDLDETIYKINEIKFK